MRKFIFSILLVAGLALLGSSLAEASPVFIEESGSFKTPDPAFEYFARHVAIDGDNALALGEHFVMDGVLIEGRRRAALWFQKSGSSWVYKGTLADVTIADETVSPALALRGGVAGFIGDRLRVFEYDGTNFVAAAVTGNANGPNLVIDDGRIFGSDTSNCEWDANVFTRSGAAWSVSQHFDGPYFGCNDSMPGSAISLSGQVALIGFPFSDDDELPRVGLYFTTTGVLNQKLGPDGRNTSAWGVDVATDGGAQYISGSKDIGVARIGPGAEDWVFDGWMRPLDTYMTNNTRTVRATADYVFQNTWNYERGAWVVNVFRRGGGDGFSGEHVAVLVGKNGAALGTRFDVSGNRVIVSGNSGFTGDNTAHVFDLPASFPATSTTLQDHFQTGNAAGWTILPGSQFSIVQDYRSLRWRQSNVAGYAGAVLNGSDRTVQGVQAEVIRRATDGADRWLAVMTRYTDGGNYYYASLRDSNRVELRKIVNGRFTLIAGAAFTMRPNTPYRLQLVSVGNLHQVFVDGKKVLQGFDSSHSHGLAGVRTYKTAADFDNVVVTGRAHTTIYRTDFSTEWLNDGGFGCCSGGTWELGTVRAGQLSQRATAGLALTNVSEPATDQVVQARITPDAFGTPPSGQTAWFGLYSKSYYLAVQPNNQMRLLKRFSWGYQVLGTITFTLPTTQREYRLEVIGNRIRAFVDGRPMIEAEDSAASTLVGYRGLATNYAQASFDDLLAYQP